MFVATIPTRPVVLVRNRSNELTLDVFYRNSFRRAALRAAVSASRAPATKVQMLGVATQISAPRIIVPVAVRCFSQTLRVANEEPATNIEEG